MRQEAELLSDAEIDVARLTGLQQCRVARQYRGDPNFLLAVVAVDQSPAGRRRNQKPNPFSWAEDVLRVARLIPTWRSLSRSFDSE